LFPLGRRAEKVGFCLVEARDKEFSTFLDLSRYLVKPFNFYLTAATHKDTGIERRFLVQASSIEFLSEYHFNFNKAFHYGT
jgi:hypothetical protein